MAETGFVISIDGPAASGKGTLARLLARELGYAHLDTGLTYRAVAHALLQVGLPLDNEALGVEVANNIDFSALDRTILSAHEIGEAASKIAVMSDVRAALVAAQRSFSEKLPGAILDGRDIGTVVCPNADVKFYVTANAQVRADRRVQEINDKGDKAEPKSILQDIITRDERDMSREDSPLKPAQDAHLIDTSKMDIETAFHTTLALIRKVQAG